MTSNNHSVEKILQIQWNDDLKTYTQTAKDFLEPNSFQDTLKALAQREEALLTYIADMFGISKAEMLKTAKMWREK
jgi:hypothetical protein